jgi:hypothetical protein
MLKKILYTVFLGMILSAFMFPVSLSFLPSSLNTKMILAVFGIIVFVFDCISRHSVSVFRTTVVSALLAVLLSVWCLYSISANGTHDTTYTKYWLSFATWLGGAYGTCWLIRELEGKLDAEKLTYYLAIVCFAQCVLALMIDNSPSFANRVDRVFVQGQEFYHDVNRLYGIGASLDTAGVRFSVVLVLIAHQMSAYGKAWSNTGLTIFYFVSFALITLVGSIIARTTWTGSILGIVYMLFSFIHVRRGFITAHQISFWLLLIAITFITVLVSSWLYRHNPDFRHNLRFGFEGFFNWAETGSFNIGSTSKLMRTMWVWPKDVRSWIIGTGRFENWAFGTDIGYCRFTLYFGLVGLFLFSVFFIYNGIAVIRHCPDYVFPSLLLIALTFIIWLKVSTDIFFIYALLFCTAREMEMCELTE